MKITNVQFVRKSSNAKTGPIPTTTTSRESCPKACPLSGERGCYAEAGYYTRLNWDAVDAGKRGAPWAALCEKVRALPAGQLWRHNVAGDLPHNRERIDSRLLSDLIDANTGRRGFTYTHHSMRNAHNRRAVETANALGFAINLSADDPAAADKLAALGIAPVVCILPQDYARKEKGGAFSESWGDYLLRVKNLTHETPQGRRIIVCPAVIRDNKTCANCGICAEINRAQIVGFPAHGASKARIPVNQKTGA